MGMCSDTPTMTIPQLLTANQVDGATETSHSDYTQKGGL